MKVVTITSKLLAPAVAKDLSSEFLKPFYKEFPDGEPYIRFDRRFDDEEVLFIQTTYPDQDKRLHEIYFAVHTFKRCGVKKVGAVIPYLAYMRQDRDFSEELGIGYEAISARVVVKNLENCGIDELYTVDVHSTEILKQSSIFVDNLDPSHLFSKYITKRKIKKPLIVAPDKNARPKVLNIANSLDTDYLFLEKERDRVTGKIKTKDLLSSLKAENVVIIDDMISTGDTIVESCRAIRKAGAKNIFAMCTHALMVKDAEEKIIRQGIEIISTDSIENKFSKISLAPLIVKLFKD